MPQIITTTVFTIDELSEAAKEKARCWYREHGLPDEWHDYIFDDFKTVCRIIGVTLSTHPVRLYGGGTRDEPDIWYRGFWSQGDGACYEGQYSHAPGAARALRAHAPKDTELHGILDALQHAQRRNFWQLHATFRRFGRYNHANCMKIEVERDSPTWQPPTDGPKRPSSRPSAISLTGSTGSSGRIRGGNLRRGRRRSPGHQRAHLQGRRQALLLTRPAIPAFAPNPGKLARPVPRRRPVA